MPRPAGWTQWAMSLSERDAERLYAVMGDRWCGLFLREVVNEWCLRNGLAELEDPARPKGRPRKGAA